MAYYFSVGMYFIILLGYFSFAAADCSFPENVTGLWHSADRGEATFNSTSIIGYNVDVPGLTAMDFNCIDQSGSTYLLQAVQFMSIFGRITRFFLCLEITKINDDSFYYFVGTEFDAFLSDYLFGLIDDIATISQACNRPTPYETSTFIMLIRDGSVDSGTAVTLCPVPLLAVFENVTVSKGGVTQSCNGSKLDVCTDRTQMNYTFTDPACTFTPFSADDHFSCLHYITVGSTIYMSAWNRDTTVTEPTVYQFVCYALQQIGDVVYATETPSFCTNTTTHTTPGTNRAGTAGISMFFTSTSETCLTKVNVTTVAAPAQVEEDLTALWAVMALPLWIILSLLVLLALLLFRRFGCICKKIKCPKRRPKPRPETPDIDVSRGETNPKRAFTMRSDVYFKQNGMSISLFRPKKSLKIFPLFDSWDPGSLPFILPLPKVEPIYHDPLEVYMRDRLPRRKSALSLYSFDAVFVGNGNGTVTHK